MGGNLEDRVCRGITDQPSLLLMGRTQIFDDPGSRSRSVADQLVAGIEFKALNEFGGKGREFSREDMKSLLHDNTCEFPMSGGGILAPGLLPHGSERGQRVPHRRTAVHLRPGQGSTIPQSQSPQCRPPRRAALSSGRTHRSQRMRTSVTVLLGIRRSSYAQGVDNNYNAPPHYPPPLLIRSWISGDIGGG